MTSTTLKYFNQDTMYYSESSGAMVPITEMATPHLAHAYRKLLYQTGGQFLNTPLYFAMRRELRPPKSILQFLLTKYGAASFMYDSVVEIRNVRSRFYRAAKDTDVIIQTHTDHKLGLVKAEVVTPPVRVKGRTISA
jgi:hypothetical protein